MYYIYTSIYIYIYNVCSSNDLNKLRDTCVLMEGRGGSKWHPRYAGGVGNFECRTGLWKRGRQKQPQQFDTVDSTCIAVFSVLQWGAGVFRTTGHFEVHSVWLSAIESARVCVYIYTHICLFIYIYSEEETGNWDSFGIYSKSKIWDKKKSDFWFRFWIFADGFCVLLSMDNCDVLCMRVCMCVCVCVCVCAYMHI